MRGAQTSLSTLPTTPPPALSGELEFSELSPLCLGSGPHPMVPPGPRRQEDVTEAREGKTTRSRPLGGTLCAMVFGSAPVLTSSGSGTQMYGSLVVFSRASRVFSKVGRKRLFFLKVTYNKLMAEEIRADGGEEESNVALFNTSDRWDYHLWTTAKVCCFILMRPSSSSFSSQKSPPPFYF